MRGNISPQERPKKPRTWHKRYAVSSGTLRVVMTLCVMTTWHHKSYGHSSNSGKSETEKPKTTNVDILPGDAYDQICGSSLVDKGLGNEGMAINGFASALILAPNVSVAWYEMGLMLGSHGSSLDADRCLCTASRLHRQNMRAVESRKELRARGGKFPPILPSIELGNEVGAMTGLTTEQRAAKEHQSRYKRRLYERYYSLDASVRRHAQLLDQNPLDFEAILASAKLHSELLEHRKAAALYQKASVLKPKDSDVFIRQIDAQVKGCVFDGWDLSFANLESLILTQVAKGEEPSLGPIDSTIYPLSPAVSLAICKFLGTANQKQVDAARVGPPLPIKWNVGRNGILTVAYVTSHFTSSSIGREMLFLIGAHDPSRVAVACYALNPDEGSWLQHTWRENIARVCAKFVDLSGKDDAQAAQIINAGGTHVLMDLNGWSGGHRESIIARRPAPVQVNYKNWVASSGIPNLHYNIGDKVASPPEFEQDYTEGMVLVPNSYFISGHKFQYLLDHPIQAAAAVDASPGERAKWREKHELPRDDFLIANFNNLDKLEPRVWRMWRAIVERNKGVSLWLQKYPPAKANRVRELAEEEGGTLPSRLTMTPFFSSDQHIAIKALGDVFADNPTYNAHSTAMDTLWGALPLCTLPEMKMSARVGASLLCALGVTDTIARDLNDMENIIEALVRHPRRRREARRRLEQARFSKPLYDTVRSVRNLEVALRCMWETSIQEDRPPHERYNIATADVIRGGESEPALEKKLHTMRVETAHAEQV